VGAARSTDPLRISRASNDWSIDKEGLLPRRRPGLWIVLWLFFAYDDASVRHLQLVFFGVGCLLAGPFPIFYTMPNRTRLAWSQ
jgi:hypothetical protein